MPRQQTIRINQGYQVDSKWEALALTGKGVRRCARMRWHYRTELGLAALVLVLWVGVSPAVCCNAKYERTAPAATSVSAAGVMNRSDSCR